MKIRHIVGLSFVLPCMMLVGCKTMGANYVRPDQALPSNYIEPLPVVSEGSALKSQWWTLYHDVVLDDLMLKATANNTDIKNAVARIDEADGFLREIGAALFPEVDLKSGATRYKVTDNGSVPLMGLSPFRSDYNAQLDTSFELDFWGKLRRAKESAKAEALGSRFAKDTVDLSLKSLVAGDYLLYRSLDAQIELSKLNIKTREESLSLTKQRLAAGVSSELDVNQASAAYTNLKAQLADLIRQRAVIEHQLAILTGDLSLKIPPGNIESLPVPPTPPIGLPSKLLESRPDVRQAEQNLISANAKIGVAKAALFPTISLTAGLGFESQDLSNILKSPSKIWNGGLGLDLPIFDAGRLNSRVDQASAQQRQLLAAYESAVQHAFEEVNDALVGLRQNTEKETALGESKNAASSALAIAGNRYKYGYVSYLEVLDAQRVYNDASLAYIQSRQARLNSTVDLFKALGGGWVDSIYH